MKVSTKKDNPLIVSCSKFSFTKNKFYLQERQLFDRFIKIMSSSKLELEDSYFNTPNNFQHTLYIFFENKRLTENNAYTKIINQFLIL